MSTFYELINDSKPVLVDFFATWCGPCKAMNPELEKLKKIMGDELRIIKIDVDINPAVAMNYNISGVPTLMLFKKGTILWRQSGGMSSQQLAKTLQSKLDV